MPGFRNAWVLRPDQPMDPMRDVAGRHGLTMLQLACLWNLSHTAVRSVVPTLIQEVGPNSTTIESQVDELASLPELKLTEEERDFIAHAGDNRWCMELKGASCAHIGNPEEDRW